MDIIKWGVDIKVIILPLVPYFRKCFSLLADVIIFGVTHSWQYYLTYQQPSDGWWSQKGKGSKGRRSHLLLKWSHDNHLQPYSLVIKDKAILSSQNSFIDTKMCSSMLYLWKETPVVSVQPLGKNKVMSSVLQTAEQTSARILCNL